MKAANKKGTTRKTTAKKTNANQKKDNKKNKQEQAPTLIPEGPGEITPEESIPFEDKKDKPLKVYFFWYNINFHSGARVHDFQFINSLAKIGHNVVVCTNTKPIFLQDFKISGNVKWIIKNEFSVEDVADADIVMCSTGPWITKSLKLAKEAGKKFWFFSYCPENWSHLEIDKTALPQHEETFFVDKYTKSDLIITSSYMARNKFIAWIPGLEMKVEIVRPYINSKSFPAADVKKEHSVTFCGRITEYKGWHDFLNWTDEYRKKYDPSLKINLIASNASYQKSILKINFEAYENITEAKKFEIMKSSAVGVSFSRFESFGLVPAEFLLLGVPVVARDIDQLKSEYGNSLLYFADKLSYFNALTKALKQTEPIHEEKLKIAMTEERMIADIESIIRRHVYGS